jgi:hypothetical protein
LWKEVKTMARELKSIDITAIPELVQLADEVRKTKKPRLLRRGDEDVAMLVPAEPKESRRRVRAGRPLRKGDALSKIIGMIQSEGPTDVSSNKHKYLAEAYVPKTE